MQDKEARAWLEFFMKQPEERQAEKLRAEAPGVTSFVIDLVDDTFYITFRFDDGRERAIALSEDIALYMREYLNSGLMERATRRR